MSDNNSSRRSGTFPFWKLLHSAGSDARDRACASLASADASDTQERPDQPGPSSVPRHPGWPRFNGGSPAQGMAREPLAMASGTGGLDKCPPPLKTPHLSVDLRVALAMIPKVPEHPASPGTRGLCPPSPMPPMPLPPGAYIDQSRSIPPTWKTRRGRSISAYPAADAAQAPTAMPERAGASARATTTVKSRSEG